MVFPKGTKFSAAHRRHMSEARRASPAVQVHHERMRTIMKGRHPKAATASRLAIVALKKMGLTRKQAPELFEGYFDFYMKRFLTLTKEPVPA